MLIIAPSRRVRVAVPKGLILPFDSSGSVPTGWTQWTAANGRYLVGAGNSYSVGATGGQTTISLSMSLDTAGSHAGAGGYNGDTAGSSNGDWSGTLWSGDHIHTIINSSASYGVPGEEFKLIQAAADLNEIPLNCLVLATGALSGLTNVTSYNGRLLKGGATLAAVGSNTIASQTLSSIGPHVHGGTSLKSSAGTGGYWAVGAGAHSGTADVTITPKVKRKLLSIWKNASAAFVPMAGIIGMWLSLYPPPGWEICNGANGTPNLRDYFIEFVTTGSENTTGTGTNVVDAAVSFSHSASHSHLGSAIRAMYSGFYHSTYAWSHSHTGSQTGISYVPYYYAVVFIQKKV